MIIDTTCSAMERKIKRALELELKIFDLPKWKMSNFKITSVTASKNTPVVFECEAFADVHFDMDIHWSNTNIYWSNVVTPEQNDPNLTVATGHVTYNYTWK